MTDKTENPSPPVNIPPYQARLFSYAGLWDIGGCQLKAYEIRGAADAEIKTSLRKAAKDWTSNALPKFSRAGHTHYGLGYAVLHQGSLANWLLIHCWAYEDIVLAALGKAAPGSSEFSDASKDFFHACVWEHIVIHHERGAWVNRMMTGQNGAGDYLRDHLVGGAY